MVFVRNTFVDIDDCSPSIQRIRRRPLKTLPASSNDFGLLDELDEAGKHGSPTEKQHEVTGDEHNTKSAQCSKISKHHGGVGQHLQAHQQTHQHAQQQQQWHQQHHQHQEKQEQQEQEKQHTKQHPQQTRLLNEQLHDANRGLQETDKKLLLLANFLDSRSGGEKSGFSNVVQGGTTGQGSRENAALTPTSAAAVATEPVEFPEESQKNLQGSIPILRVRNTFLELDASSPSVARLRRRPWSKTLPAAASAFMSIENQEEIDSPITSEENAADSQSRCSFEASVELLQTSPMQNVVRRSAPENHEGSTQAVNETITGNLHCGCTNREQLHAQPATAHVPMEKTVKVPEAMSMPRGQSLTWTRCSRSGRTDACWTVSARKVQGTDKQAVSPPLEVPLGQKGDHVRLRIVLYPKASASNHALNFKKARGRGYIQVKCESSSIHHPALVRVTLSVGTGCRAQAVRGPIWHDFGVKGICALPKDHENWDFCSAVSKETMVFPVFISITPASGA